MQWLNTIIQGRERALGSFAVGRTLAVVVGLSAVLYLVIAEVGFSWEAVVVTGVIGFVVIALSQAVPRRLAEINPERYGARMAPVMHRLFSLLLYPALVLEAPALVATRLLKMSPAPPPAPEALEQLLAREEAGQVIDDEEREMLQNVIEIGETVVREAMIPRPDIVAIEIGTDLRAAATIAVESGYSRLPVFEGSIDNVIGVLYAKDILAKLVVGEEIGVQQLARPPLFIPESKTIDATLTDLRKSRVHLAVVLDEYGGTAGLITLEDLVEEIVGEIEDEYDEAVAPVVSISEDEAIMDGRAPATHLDELFGVRVADGDFDSVGGLVFDRLGKIPQVNDEVNVDGLRVTVDRHGGPPDREGARPPGDGGRRPGRERHPRPIHRCPRAAGPLDCPTGSLWLRARLRAISRSGWR